MIAHPVQGEAPPLPVHEAQRLELLASCRILDTPADADFDDLSRLAAQLCNAPIALISLLDQRRQWFKSRIGLEVQETPRRWSFCAHALEQPEKLLIVPDATRDPRFAENPLVTGAPHIRFYAGAPLVMEKGLALGTLCVIDTEPRALAPEQVESLQALARQVVSQLRLRRQNFALRGVQEEREAFFNRPLDMLAVVDARGCFTMLNPAFQETLGYSLEELQGRAALEFIHPDDLSASHGDLSRLNAGYPLTNFEQRFRAKDGTYRWLSWKCAPGDDGQIYASARDVTKQKIIQMRLEKVSRMQRAVLDRAAHAIITTTPDGKITHFNPAAERMLGWQADEVLGKHSPAVWHDRQELVARAAQYSRELGIEITPGFEVFAAKARRRLPNEDEWKVIRKDGAHRLIQLSVNAVFQGDDVAALIGIAVDITERKRAEARLRESERRFREAIEYSAIGMALVGLDGAWLKVNRAVCNMLGWSEEELLRRTFQDLTHPADLDADLTCVQQLLNGEIDHYQIDKRYLHKGGHPIWSTLAVTLVRDGDGRPAYFVAQIKDITERREAHERLTASLAEKNSLLQEVHHRVKNNLQVVSSLLSLQAGYIEDPGMLAMFRESQDRIRSMALIHEKLYQSESLARVDLRDYLESLSRMILSAYAQGRDVRLELDLAAFSGSIDTAVPLGLLVNELLTNAVKYAFPGDRAGRVLVILRREGDGGVTLIVEDDGIGLPAGFVAAEATTLGMRLIGMLVKQLGAGFAEVSTPGCTRFAIHLPERAPAPS